MSKVIAGCTASVYGAEGEVMGEIAVFPDGQATVANYEACIRQWLDDP